MKHIEQKKSIFRTVLLVLFSLMFMAVGAFTAFFSLNTSSNRRSVFAAAGKLNSGNPAAPSIETTTGANITGQLGANFATEPGADHTLLIEKDAVTGTWLDTFRVDGVADSKIKPLKELANLEEADGNFFKKAGADGSKESPYQIANAKELAFLSAVFESRGATWTDNTELKVNNKYFKLMADLDLKEHEWLPIVDYRFSNAPTYNVYFDGNGHTIKNVFMDQSEAKKDGKYVSEAYSVASVFGCWYNGRIENLTIENANIIGSYRASVVASSCQSNYNPTKFENVHVKNSKVVSNRCSAGIADSALYMKDCTVSKSEVIVNEFTDEDRKAINIGNDYYALGLGRANEISMLNKANIISDSIVKYEATFDNYDVITENRTDNHYIAGVGISRDGAPINIGNFNVVNTKVLNNLTMTDANGNSEDGSFKTMTFNNYVTGAYRAIHGLNGIGQLHDITVENSEVKSNWQYEQTNPEMNKNIMPYIKDYVVGVGRFYSSAAIEDGYHFDNLLTKNSTIESVGKATLVTPPSDSKQSTSGSGTYHYVNFEGTVDGVLDSSSSTLTARNCVLEGSKVNLTRDTNACKDNNFYIIQNLHAYGVGSGVYTTHYGSQVKDSKINVLNKMYSQGATEAEADYYNVTQTRARIVGIGQGKFLKNGDIPCKVVNSEFTAESQGKRDEGDKSTNYYTDGHIIGLGYLESSLSTKFEESEVSNLTLTSKSSLGSAYVVGMGQTMSWSGEGLAITGGSKLENIKINSNGKYSYVFGLAYNSSRLRAGTVIGDTQKPITINKIDITSQSVYDANITAGHYNANYSKGIDIQNIDASNVKINATSEEKSINAATVAYNYSSLYSSDISEEYCSNTLKNIHVSNIDMNLNAETDIYMSGINRTSSGYGPFSITDSDINQAKMLAVSKNGVIYATGMTYNGKSADKLEPVYAMEGCRVSNVDIYATCNENIDLDANIAEQSELYKNTRTSSRVAGLMIAYTTSAASVNNCVVEKSNFRSFGTGSSMTIASGMVISFSNSANNDITTYNKNTVKNCNVQSATGLGTYSSPSGAYATGMILNQDSKELEVTNNEVESSNVIVVSAVNNTEAAGLVLQRSSKAGIVKDCYAKANFVYSEFISGGNGLSVNTYATGLAGTYLDSINACVVTDGDVIAKNSVGKSYAVGIATTYYLYNDYYRPESATQAPLTKITDCYNFADVSATTDSTNNSYAAGIGQAEFFNKCSNYGEVQGNYAGGISYGFYRTYDPGIRYSIPLTIKNCVNNGNIYRAQAGQRSYIGGIVSTYYMLAPQYTSLILENNVSLGGVYSAKQRNGRLKQDLSSQTYLGMLYGYLNFSTMSTLSSSDMQNKTGQYPTIMNRYSIRNNSILIEKDGINSALYQEKQTEDIIGFKNNFPERNYFATAHGVFYSNGNTTNNDTYTDMFKQIYTDFVSMPADEVKTNTNKELTKSYTVTDINSYTKSVADYAKTNGWEEYNKGNGIAPQVKTTVKPQIILFDLNGRAGQVPHVMLITKGTEFKLPSARLSQTGISVTGWLQQAGQIGEAHPVESKIILASNDYSVITLYAKHNYTVYTISVVSNPDGEIQELQFAGAVANGNGISLENTNVSISVKYKGGNNPTAINWFVQNDSTGKKKSLLFEGANKAEANTLNLANYFSSQFIDNYADRNTIKIIVEYTTENVYTFTVNDTSVDILSKNSYSYSVTNSSGDLLKVKDAETGKYETTETEITITVTPNKHFEFVSMTNANGTVTHTENIYKFTVNSNDNVIGMNVQRIKYAIDVELQNKQAQVLSSDLLTTLTKDVASKTISIGDNLPQLEAKTDNSNYRFIGWRFLGSDSNQFIPEASNQAGKVDAGVTVLPADFDRYIKGDSFRLIAVFQKQFTITVNMHNPEGYASAYDLTYLNQNDVLVTEKNYDETGIISSNGSYIIDENTFVTISLTPNKRVSVSEPQNVDFFDGKKALVILDDNKIIDFVFDIRPLSVQLETLNVLSPELYEGVYERSLTSAINYVVLGDTPEGNVTNPEKVNINDKLVLSFNEGTLKTEAARYRGINLNVKNIVTGQYDAVSEFVINDAFFDNYVTDDGTFTIMLKVIRQYTVNVIGNNLVTNDNFTIGDFEVAIKDGEDIAKSERYEVVETEKANVKKYFIDNGINVVVTPVVKSKYASFTSYDGLFEEELINDEVSGRKSVIENDILNITINQDRAFTLRFDKNSYAIDAKINAAVGGKLNANNNFQLGDTISLSYTPENNYQILDWKIANKALTEIGGKLTGNTVSIYLDEATLDTLLNLNILDLNNRKLDLVSNLDTMMSPTLFYGLIIGGVVILLLAALLTFLLIRQSKLKKQKAEQERKLNDIARKFNIGNLISDLKAGKDVDFGQDKSKK